MFQSGSRGRQAACPCGSRRSFAGCCLPWEEAFQRLFSRLVAFAAAPRIRRYEEAAAAVFWNTQRPLQPGDGRSAGESLRFLEWLLHDRTTRRGGGPLLGEFADAAIDLSLQEEDLLFASLLAPARAYEVTDTLARQGFLVKDLLTGAERAVSPLGLAEPPIRSDVMICRLLPLGRLLRFGASVLVLPATGRQELLGYLRTTYQVTRPGRHLSLEDFLDTSAHLYHHFFLLRGRGLDGRARETLRHVTFAPGRASYRGTHVSRIRAGLDRQPELIREAETGDQVRYVWIDRRRSVTRAILVVRNGELEISADTREDLAEARRFLEESLHGLIQPAGEHVGEAAGFGLEEVSRPGSALPGEVFYARMLAGWPGRSSPYLEDRTPREAVKSRAGRQQVAALLLGLERDFARLKRLGRAWADIIPLREHLDLPPGPHGPDRRAR